MRIASAHTYDTSIENLQTRQSELAAAQSQMTTGKKVNVPSDDPIAAARAERALATINRSDANQRAIDASRNVMQLGESSLGDAVELLQQARESLIAAGNASYSDSERHSVAIKLKEIRNQLLSVANRSDGGGGFVFGGQGSSTPPFVDAPGGVKFIGQGGEARASGGENMNLTVDGQEVWLKAKTGNGVFETNANAANTGTAWISPGTVASPSAVPYPAAPNTTPSAYAIQFDVTGGVTTYTMLKDGSPVTAGAPYTSGQAITVDGMSVTITGQPKTGDEFTIGQSSNNLSVFDTLDKAIAALNTTGQNQGQITQAVNFGLSDVDSILGNIQGARSEVGESLNRLDGVESRNSSSKLEAQTARSNAEDLDMVKAISDFQSQQSGYDAALKSYSIVQKLSLFQYLNV